MELDQSGSNLLFQNFDKALNLFKELENNELPSSSVQYQNKVKLAIDLLEKSTEMVNQLELFSINETIEDISTSSLKYLLLPSLLGYFSTKITYKPRQECLDMAEIYFKDFIKRLKDMGKRDIEYDEEEIEDSKSAKITKSLEDMALERSRKIEKYKRKKKIEQELENIQHKIENDQDEEITRKFYLLNISNWIETSIDELESIKKEKELLAQFKDVQAMKNSNEKKEETNEDKKEVKSFRPFIITRTEHQRKVFGLGYPSVPSVSIENFVEQKIKEGSLSVANEKIYSNSLQEWALDNEKKKREDEEIEKKKEELIENDDEETLRKAREFDEFKDNVKRGSGNRYSRS